jgi:predicted dehydrogenase
MPDKVKIGLAGCGAGVTMHLSVGKHLDSGEFTALMDTDKDRLEQVQETYGIGRGYTDYDDFLAHSGVDAVIIASPPVFHYPQALKAAEHKKHILCEKPMAPSVGECEEIRAACEKNKVCLMIGLMKRFDPSMLRVKEIIDSGELGNIYQITSSWSWWQMEGEIPWRDRIDFTHGGLYQDHGSHVTDLSRWWIGDIDHVSAEINIIRKGREVEDNAVVTYKHQSGAVSVHLQSRMTNKPLSEYYLIDGRKGSLEVEFKGFWSAYSQDPFTLTLYKKGSTAENVSVSRESNVDDEIRKHGRYRNQLEYFCTCIQRNKKPETGTPRDGTKAIEAINAAYLSSSLGKKIKLPLDREYERIDFNDLFKSIRDRSPAF